MKTTAVLVLVALAGCGADEAPTQVAKGVKHPGACSETRWRDADVLVDRILRDWHAGLNTREELRVFDDRTRYQAYQTIEDHVLSFQHDGARRVIAVDRDHLADGEVDEKERFTFDALGRPATRSVSSGQGELSERWTYGPFGVLERVEVHPSGLTFRTATGWDDQGRKLLEESFTDGVRQQRQAWTHGVFGPLTHTIEAGSRFLSPRSERTVWSYRADGTLAFTVLENDFDADGEIDRFTRTFHEASGLPARVEVEQPIGTVDEIRTIQYDPAGRVFRARQLGAGGTIYVDDEFHYDAAGRVIETIHYPTRWAPEHRVVTDSYDAAGNQVRSETRGERGLTAVVTWRHDAAGNLLFEEARDGAGRIDYARRLRWDAGNNLVEEAFDRDGDGSFRDRTVFSYDCF